MRSSGNTFYTPDKLFDGPHLSDEGQALAADALALERTPDLPEAVLEHLGECQECRESVMELHQIQLADGILPRAEDHPFFGEGRQTADAPPYPWIRMLKYAAIFLVVFLPGIILLTRIPALSEYSFSRWMSELLWDTKTDPFAIDPAMESMVGMVFRDVDFNVQSPLSGDTLSSGDLIQVIYEGRESENLAIEFIDNRGVICYKTNIYGGSARLETEFAPGLYYWKLSSGKELLHIGKIYLVANQE